MATLHTGAARKGLGGQALPPGLPLPRLVQTVLFMGVKNRLLRRCQRRYGSAFTVRVAGNRTLVMLSDPADIRQVFAGPADVFHAGEGNVILAPVMGKHSVLLLDEDEHLRARRRLMPAFNGAALRGYRTMMAELAEADAERWPVGQRFGVHRRMNAVTLEIILRVVFGMAGGDRLARLRPLIGRLTEIGPLSVLGWTYPLLQRFGAWRRNRENLDAADRLIYAEIAERRGVADLAERGDVLSRLLAADAGLSDVELRDHMMTLLLAGHETTATALAWSFHELARYPEVQRVARRAADDGDDEYLTAVAKEAMRRRPVVQNVVRKLTAPTEVAGYLLPAGTVVAPSINLVHKDSAHHPRPYQFDPGRFVGAQPETGSWIPFGGGVRRCLGAGFSLQEASAVLRAALRRYEIRPAHEGPEPSKARNITLTPAHGAQIIAVPR